MKTKLDLENLQKFYQLRNIPRYGQRYRSFNESVAEHTYFVILFSDRICKYLKLNNSLTKSILEYAIVHDLPEMYTGDIPYDVKYQFPKLKETLTTIEHSTMQDHIPEMYKVYRNNSKNSHKIELIVKMADILSVIQYSYLSVAIGNTIFKDVLEGSIERYEDQKKEIIKEFNIDKFDLFDVKN